jgi:hypothetical protein
MVCFQTKSPNLGKFWGALDWKILIYFMAVCSILWTFGKIYDHLVHFVLIWNIFPVSVSPTKKNLATLIAGLAPERRIRSRPSVSNLLNPHSVHQQIQRTS